LINLVSGLDFKLLFASLAAIGGLSDFESAGFPSSTNAVSARPQNLPDSGLLAFGCVSGRSVASSLKTYGAYILAVPFLWQSPAPW
jgi:hypothetical protein